MIKEPKSVEEISLPEYLTRKIDGTQFLASQKIDGKRLFDQSGIP